MNIMEFFDSTSEEERRGVFSNGTVDFWDEMPEFIIEEQAKKIINISFGTIEEIYEFYELIEYGPKWGGKALKWSPDGPKVRTAWFPAKDFEANRTLRIIHIDTYLANKDKYELVSFDEIKK